jgi:AGZA family xanthine/uracil permease-like MFS transporter
MFHLMRWAGWLHVSAPNIDPAQGLLPTDWLTVFRLQWLQAFWDTLPYLPVILPFALATVVGGIDCTESAAAAGDDYDTKQVIAVEAVATLVAGLCGGVVQTTPYIGHPAYKAMGGRAAYALATALFVGSAGVLGYFGYLYVVIPRPAVFPILVFIGLEITSQSFASTPKRHFPAVAMACVPAMAYLALVYVDKVLPHGTQQLPPALREEIGVLRILANGYIVTSLLWASALAAMIDRRLRTAAAYFAVASCGALFGVIHSPLPGSPMFWPWQLDWEVREWVLRFSCGYALAGLILLLFHAYCRGAADEIRVDDEEP